MGLRDYFAHRTAEQRKADQEAEELEAQNKAIKEELKYQESLNRQPSRFQEDVSKVSGKIASGLKKGVSIAGSTSKKVVVGTAKTVGPLVKEAVRQGGPVVKQMAKGAAESEFYEPEQKRKKESEKEPSVKPMKMHNFNPDIAPAPRVGKKYDADQFIKETPRKQSYNGDYFVSGLPPGPPKERREERRKPMKQPEGAEKYFVNVNKKLAPKKEKKEEKGRNRGFRLGF
jgi:hypothetical protein